MDIERLYQDIRERLYDGVLVINGELYENAFKDFLFFLNIDELRITSCSAALINEKITVSGMTSAAPLKAFGSGYLTLELSIVNNTLWYELRLNLSGNVKISEICATLQEDISVFKSFILDNPAIFMSGNMFGYSLSGTARVDNRQNLSDHLWFIANTMPFKGVAVKEHNAMCFSFDFDIGETVFSLPFGNAKGKLAMRTSYPNGMYFEDPVTNEYLMLELTGENGYVFQMDINAFKNDMFYASAFPAAVISPSDVPKNLESIPLYPYFSSFGVFKLQRVSVRIYNEKEGGADGLRLGYVEFTLALREPLKVPASGFELSEVTLFSETSFIDGEAVSSFSISCEASVTVGKYKLTGRVKGYYPQQYFEGYLSFDYAELPPELYISEKEKSEFTLADMASGFNSPVPNDWGKPLAEFNVTADLIARSYSISACANGIIEFNVNGIKISLDSITVSARVSPAESEFSFDGVFGFAASETGFQIGLSARYKDKCWSFSGKLVQGEIDLADLFAGLFNKTVPEPRAKICIDGLSAEITPSKGEFMLFASFYANCFSVFGQSEFGGRVKIEKKSEDKDALYAAALFYLNLGALNFLVQADDFYSENTKYLFRLSFNKLYIQGVYYKENNDEIVKFSLGGMTFGDIALAFIHLINPNAKSSLSAPWNILDKIDLSNFSIVINATQKTASVIYSANISIAGLMQINDIGIRYSNKNGEHKIGYILTGKLLDKSYDIGEPLSWDAIDGEPPANSAAAETKTKVSYIGLARHMDITITSSSVEEAVNILKSKLKPASGNVPDFSYNEDVQWLFGVDFTLGNMFSVKAALIDPYLYGAKITVAVTEKSPLYFFNGLELELVYRKISDSTGMFRCTLTVPKSMSRLDLGAVVIYLGQISVEIYTNGSFYIDLGFPHNGDFSKSFGLQYGIFTGHGGVYFGVLKGDAVRNVPVVTNGAFSPVILMGIGLCVGIGRSFDFGVVKGSVSITAAGILEGTLALFHPSDDHPNDKEGVYYLVSASVGVNGSLFLSVDFKIISISVRAEIKAMCSLTIESYRRSVITLSLYLKLSASLKILFIKINFSFTFDKTFEFSFGSDSQTPWKLGKKEEIKPLKVYDFEMFPLIKTAMREINVSVLPLFSLEKTDKYCAAFLCVVSPADFSEICGLMLDWIMEAFSEDRVSRDMAASLSEETADALTFEKLNTFLSENFRATLIPQTQNVSEDELSGVFFPMPPCFTLEYGGISVDFGVEDASEQYCQRVNQYLAELNSDPLHKLTNSEVQNGSHSMCAVILTDYFKMILRELISLIKRQFELTSVTAQSFGALTETYGVSANKLLTQNKNILLNINSVPKLKYTLKPGDTLNDILKNILNNSVSAKSLWNDVKDISMLPARGKSIVLDKVKFDNSIAGMTVLEAAAVFFVRLYDPDITYMRYAEQIVSDNGLASDWKSAALDKECRLVVPGWHGDYIALAGDDAVRAAKASALVSGESAEGWDSFKKRFMALNPDNSAEYQVDGEYVISDNTLEELNQRLSPDYISGAGKSFLWEQPILRSFTDIAVKNANVKLSSCTPEQSGISAEEICAALDAGTADFASSQTVNISPESLGKSELYDLVIHDENTVRTGSIASRFFLQGLRIPADEKTSAITPLFKRLYQQIEIDKNAEEFSFTLKKGLAECSWADVSENNTAKMTKQEFDDALPKGDLPIAPIPAKTEDFSWVSKCWSVGTETLLLKSGARKKVCVLPDDMTDYLKQYGADTVTTAGEDEFKWGSLTRFPIIKTGENIYRFMGASPEERQMLYALLSEDISEISVLRKLTKFDTDSAEYADIAPESCMLIRTDLSTESHYGNADELKNIAGIEDKNRFLLLAWECSVIGGGFYLYITDLPDEAIDTDGKAELYLLVTLNSPREVGCINRAIRDRITDESPVFIGTAKKEYVPNYPAGCVGLYAAASPPNDSLSELFSIMGYTVTDEKNEVWESMPMLPQEDKNGGLCYSAAVPLYKLCGSGKSPYSAIGRKFALNFFRRDVLGNTYETGALDITPDYNDYLTSLNRIPRTQTRYLLQKDGGDVYITVRSVYFNSGDDNPEQAKAAALTAALQAECPIEIRFSSSFDTQYTLTDDELSRYRAFTRSVYDLICENSSAGEAEFSVSFKLDTQKLPSAVFEITLTATISRVDMKTSLEGISSAECEISRGDKFEDNFKEILPDICLAAGDHRLYGVPQKAYFEELAISPFSLDVKGRPVSSPRFYSTAPFSRNLITRKSTVTLFNGGETVEVEFSDIDIEAWIKRFLSDIEGLLKDDVLANAAVICPKYADDLTETKRVLSERFADRLLPLIDNFSGEDISAAHECAQQLFLKTLENYYGADVFCVYNSEVKHGANAVCRLEGALKGSDGLYCGKIDSQKKYFCVYSLANQKHSNEQAKLSLSPTHFEYNIRPTSYGYESSEWLRLLSLPDNEKIDFTAELGIPHPLKLFPDSPRLLSHSFRAEEKLLRYSYSLKIMCKCFEQQTLYLRLSFAGGRSRCADENKIFDVLANYSYNREELMRHISASDAEFSQAYGQITETACAFAEAISQKAEVVVPEPENNEINLRIRFKITSAVSAECEPCDKQSQAFMEKYGIKAAADVVSGGEYGGDMETEVNISGLPVYACPCVEPSARIVQNENLFNNEGVNVSKEFLFQTERVSLTPLYIHAEYIKNDLSAESVECAASDAWALLELENNARPVSVSSVCCFKVDLLTKQDIFIRIPAVFLPTVKSSEMIADAVKKWIESNGVAEAPSAIIFNINVFGEGGYDSVVSAELSIKLNGRNARK